MVEHDDGARRSRALTVALSARPDGAYQAACHDEPRLSPRVEASNAAGIKICSVTYPIEIVNLSRTGMRIAMIEGVVPKIGTWVVIEVIGRREIDAEIVWTDSVSIGLRFVEPLEDALDAIQTEDLGAEFFRAAVRFQITNG